MKRNRFIFLLLAVFMCSCETPPTVYVKQNEYVFGIKKIAILPFRNFSETKEAGKIITAIISTELYKTGFFNIIEPGEINRVMTAYKIWDTNSMGTREFEIIRKELGADGIVTGLVHEYSISANPKIGITARMINCRTGTILWICSISRSGSQNSTVFDIGRISNISELSIITISQIVQSILNDLIINKMDKYISELKLKLGQISNPDEKKKANNLLQSAEELCRKKEYAQAVKLIDEVNQIFSNNQIPKPDNL